jgi:hypothetical protein
MVMATKTETFEPSSPIFTDGTRRQPVKSTLKETAGGGAKAPDAGRRRAFNFCTGTGTVETVSGMGRGALSGLATSRGSQDRHRPHYSTTRVDPTLKLPGSLRFCFSH